METFKRKALYPLETLEEGRKKIKINLNMSGPKNVKVIYYYYSYLKFNVLISLLIIFTF